MKEKRWNSLVDSLRFERCIAVLGPEIPADWSGSEQGEKAGIPVTCADAVKEKLAAELREDDKGLVTPGTLAEVAQLYEDRERGGFGASTLRSQAARHYASLGCKPSKDHEILASLPFPLILTTCHDQLLTDALTQKGKQPVTCRYHLRGRLDENPGFEEPTAIAPVVYHLFGRSSEAQTLVLSENDLLDFVGALKSDRPPIPTTLRSRLKGDNVSLLFVGFDIYHWYQRILLKALLRFLSGDPPSEIGAVAVDPLPRAVPEPETRKQTILFYERGTRVEVSEESVSAFVAELQQRFDKDGGAIPKASATKRPLRVFVSYASGDKALATRLCKALQEANLDPWLDTDGLRGGDKWEARIDEQLESVDFVLALVTPELVRKNVGFVNVEIKKSVKRADYYRGPFLIPIMWDGVSADERIPELRAFQETRVRDAQLGEDVAALASYLRRQLQLRNR